MEVSRTSIKVAIEMMPAMSQGLCFPAADRLASQPSSLPAIKPWPDTSACNLVPVDSARRILFVGRLVRNVASFFAFCRTVGLAWLGVRRFAFMSHGALASAKPGLFVIRAHAIIQCWPGAATVFAPVTKPRISAGCSSAAPSN
jgi:hypothetical protein